MIKPAIVVVGYNRPGALKRLLQSIQAASYPQDNIPLIISIDKSDKSDEVYQVAEEINWKYGEKTVIKYEERQGLRKHILQCGDLSNKYGAVIILEDDLLVSPSFYQYAYQALNFYEQDEKVAGIALYSHRWNGYASVEFLPEQNGYDVYFGQFSITWGQCWTASQWNQFKAWYLAHQQLPDRNDKLPAAILSWGKQSWGKYFVSFIVETDKYYVIPYVAMSTNFSEIGQHNEMIDSSHQVPLLSASKENYCFCKYVDAIKYDVFFERIFNPEMKIAGIAAKDVCVNLNGIKTTTGPCKYVLAERTLPFAVLATFGLRMRPIDANISNAVKGTELKLYQCPSANTKLPGYSKILSVQRGNFALYGYTWRSLARIALNRFCQGIRRRIGKY